MTHELRRIENVFGRNGFGLLTPDEIISSAILVSSHRLDRLSGQEVLDRDLYKDNLHILVTGMPRWGKSTGIQIVEMETLGYQIPVRVESEEPIGQRPEDLRWNDSDAMTYNFSYALSGLSRLIRNSSTQNPQINIYERGLVDHLVFAEALNRLYYRCSPRYAEVIGAFRTFFGFYLASIDGIIVCNSTADTAIKRGSTLPKDLLDLLSQGYKDFPKTLSEITKGGRIDPVVTLNLDFEELENPIDKLKKAIYTMVNWSLEGKVTAYPEVTIPQ